MAAATDKAGTMCSFSVVVLDAEVLVSGDVGPDEVPILKAALTAAGGGAIVADLRSTSLLCSDAIYPLFEYATQGLTLRILSSSMIAKIIDAVRLQYVAVVVEDLESD